MSPKGRVPPDVPTCATPTHDREAPRRLCSAPAPMKRALAFSSAVIALGVFVPLRSAPANTDCSASCDKAAAACNDACETQHKDAKPRVECKIRCIEERERCEKGCK